MSRICRMLFDLTVDANAGAGERLSHACAAFFRSHLHNDVTRIVDRCASLCNQNVVVDALDVDVGEIDSTKQNWRLVLQDRFRRDLAVALEKAIANYARRSANVSCEGDVAKHVEAFGSNEADLAAAPVNARTLRRIVALPTGIADWFVMNVPILKGTRRRAHPGFVTPWRHAIRPEAATLRSPHLATRKKWLGSTGFEEEGHLVPNAQKEDRSTEAERARYTENLGYLPAMVMRLLLPRRAPTRYQMFKDWDNPAYTKSARNIRESKVLSSRLFRVAGALAFCSDYSGEKALKRRRVTRDSRTGLIAPSARARIFYRNQVPRTMGSFFPTSRKRKLEGLFPETPQRVEKSVIGRALRVNRSRFDKHILAMRRHHPLAFQSRAIPSSSREDGRIVTDAADTDLSLPIPVMNAGLVLLWPLLPAFFETCACARDAQFHNKHMQERAAMLMDGLVWSRMPVPAQHRMALNNVLCGLPVNAVMASTECILSENESGQLADWVAGLPQRLPGMHRCTPSDIQALFMQRSGALICKNGLWTLVVSKDASDILLGDLPWPIKQIPLPWCEHALTVDWL